MEERGAGGRGIYGFGVGNNEFDGTMKHQPMTSYFVHRNLNRINNAGLDYQRELS